VTEAKVPEESFGTMRSLVCGETETIPADDNSTTRFHFRNAQQDRALAAGASNADLQKLLGGCDAAARADPEWYLRVRDYLFRLR
jgi:hypothetical protein